MDPVTGPAIPAHAVPVHGCAKRTVAERTRLEERVERNNSCPANKTGPKLAQKIAPSPTSDPARATAARRRRSAFFALRFFPAHQVFRVAFETLTTYVDAT
jgi:hypothetical protein